MVWTKSWFPFQRAEIIVVRRSNDREPFGEQRKPGKWSVRFEYFDDLADAQDCRERVLDGSWTAESDDELKAATSRGEAMEAS